MLRSLDDPADLWRYLDLKAQIRDLTTRLKELEPVIYDAVSDEDNGKADALGFTLEACVSRSYAYSPAVQEAEKALRVMKATERDKHTAIVTKATGYVRVTASRATPAERERALSLADRPSLPVST